MDDNTGRWPGGLEEQGRLITWYVAVWNDLGYADPGPGQHAIPPLGERSAEAITGAYNAIVEIDQLIRDLLTLRGQLVSEIRENEDRLTAQVDATLARGRRPAMCDDKFCMLGGEHPAHPEFRAGLE